MYVKINGEWKKIGSLYLKNNGAWVVQPLSQLSSITLSNIFVYNDLTAETQFLLSVLGPSVMVGESCSYVLAKDGIAVPQSAVTWEIISGSTYATINANGVLTILSGANNSNVTIRATHFGKAKEHVVKLTYMTNVTTNTTTETETIKESGNTIERTTSTTEVTDGSGNTTTIETVVEVITNENGEVTYTEVSTTENPDGSTSEITSQTNYDEDGNVTQETESTTSTNIDGSSTSNTTTTNYDEQGNVSGSTENVTETNSDGSYSGTTTNYDANGDETGHIGETGDTAGNVSTQTVEKDEQGNDVVAGFTIDTSNNQSGSMEMDGTGVNTQFYAFDMTDGFLLNLHFTIDFTDQPVGQNENHHQVLCMKRAAPSPWYGIQIRQSSTNKYIQLGTQYATGSNSNTTIREGRRISSNVYEYDIQIIYDPIAESNNFICRELISNTLVRQDSNTFPDLPELRYLTVCVGYALDENGDPYRYSNINVQNFSITKLSRVLANPVISCDGEHVTITCETDGSSIYYRLNQTGNYSQYSSPITITADTVVEAYSVRGTVTSNTVSQTCVFDNGVEAPIIVCDGETVTITCDTPNVDLYYRLNQEGSYSAYTEAFTITADTVVQSYAVLDGKTSTTVTQNCIYSVEHNYSLDYLTLRVLTTGTLCWTSVGSGSTKTIQYSVNNGTWTTWTPPTDGSSACINVSADDVVRVKGNNTSYAISNTDYTGFAGGTANFNAEGNIMSLVYGDNFVGHTALTGSYNFCSLFKLANLISAENLILPATTMTPHCYRALFANNSLLTVAPALPATTLAVSCYRYMFQDCSITTAPDLLATTLVQGCYDGMFNGCSNLNYIRCMATNIETATASTVAWVQNVASSGTFVKEANTVWSRGNSAIPAKWVIVDEGLKMPTISCDGLSVTLSCGTAGASVYYRLNSQGEFALYSSAITITADTFVEAYSQLNGETSSTVSQTCVYDDGIEEPVIYCDGEYITMSCDTPGAAIYYKLDHAQAYTQYEEAIVITADTFCEAYAEINGVQSEIVSSTCIYDESLKAPVIECDGTGVTIVCHSTGADIYYRLNQEGNYTLYSSVITITADTVVQAYSTLDGETSSTVTETCIYDSTHHYELDYLTFRVLTDGTIKWNSIGSGQEKVIQYSKNDGAWTTITASTSTTISVNTGDVVRFRGNNSSYAKDKSNYSGFEGGTALFDIEGNIMSLIYGPSFVGETALTGTYNFCSIFKLANCVSAENLVLPSTALTNYCYRAMFSKCTALEVAPALPATTLSQGCYWYMFESCSITRAPELLAPTMVRECYGYMFTGCRSLAYIKCMATAGLSAASGKTGWVQNVASSGTFVKDSSVSTSTWGSGNNGIPTGWLVYDNVEVSAPVIYCDGNNNVTITCSTQGATVYFKKGDETAYTEYSSAITITATTIFNAYSEFNGQESRVVTQTCEYISNIPLEACNRDLTKWNYNNTEVTVPYSVNALDGHSASYSKGVFNFETNFALRSAETTYLWFQHADQSATIYIDDTLVEKHWGGYNAFFVDVSNYVHAGTNTLKVALKNNEGNNLAPASGDFNFNATLGKAKLFTSPYLPSMEYGYDGFHIRADVATSSATIYIKTSVPTGAMVSITIDDGTYHYETSSASTGTEIIFTTTISNPHLWNGTLDPHLYTITMEIYHNGDLYHRYQRPYGLRFYEYVIDDTSVLQSGDPYTGFLLNGSPYLLRGVCMHDDIEGKANALNDTDYANTFATIQELGCNFIRLAHYPHTRDTYDWCDRLGIIVETEVPCVNKLHTTMPNDYYDHLNGQYDDMVKQHYNHPCIIFWGLSNETTTDDKSFGNTKINGYISRIKALDNERMVGFVMAKQSVDPSTYYNDPNADWFGVNMYEGWYYDTTSNNPTRLINTHVNALINTKHKAMAYSEYGAGGTQRCHSDDFMTTTTRGNKERHDIEYQMWLHEGHIAAIRNYPQLIFTSVWQLFDIAVSNRNEGYTVCPDGENSSVDDSLRRLNDKGLVERDHVTKKDTFYLYKAEWSSQNFVHICGKDYTKTTDRVIKCYTNDGNSLSLYVNNSASPVETVTVTDHIATFTARNFSAGDIIRVDAANTTDTFTFDS